MPGSDAIPASSVRFLVEGLNGLGHPPAEVARRCGIDASCLEPEGVLSRASCVALMEASLRLEGPRAGLRIGSAVPTGALGLVDHLTGAAPTARDALDDLVRYFALVATGVRLELRQSTLAMELPPWPLSFRQLLAEATFAIVDQRLTTRVGSPLDPVEVAFPWPEPSDSEVLRSQWPTVSFDADEPRVSFRPDRLDASLATSDASLRALLSRYAHAELGQRLNATTIEGRVSQHLIETLPTLPSADEVARELGMSPRSLRRALAAEGTTFTSVRDRCLRRIAEKALRDPSQTIGEVAWLLGYSEASAFHRAFRRWTGSTPEQFRRGPRTAAR